jgi:hypothetical protein
LWKGRRSEGQAEEGDEDGRDATTENKEGGEEAVLGTNAELVKGEVPEVGSETGGEGREAERGKR